MDKILDLLLAIVKLLSGKDAPPPVPDPDPDPVPDPDPIPETSFFSAVPIGGVLVKDRLVRGDNLKDHSQVDYFGRVMQEGFHVAKKSNAVRYHIPTVSSGYVQFEIIGIDPATTVSRMLLTMFDNTDDQGSQNAWLARIQQHSPASTRTKNYLRVRWLQNFDNVNAEQYDEASSFNQWKSDWNLVRLEWKHSEVALFVNGKRQFTFNKSAVYRPAEHVVELGGKYRNEAAIGAMYRSLEIGVIDSGPVPPPPPPSNKIVWETFQREKLGFKSSLKLHNTIHFWAFKAIQDAMLWDGIRNPQAALKVGGWKSYEGHSRSDVERIIARNVKQLKVLDNMAHVKKVDKYHPFPQDVDENGYAGWAHFVYTSGPIIEGTMDLDVYRDKMKVILDAASEGAGLNGIRGIVKGNKSGFKF